jgi:hypothetical protein
VVAASPSLFDAPAELLEGLLADAGSEPGVLPLLQETLVQLWERRQGQALALTDYRALGDGDRSGLAVAMSRRADATLDELTPAQEAIARRILLRLVSFGEGRSDTRRQQPRSRLRAAGDDAGDFEHVLGRLIEARLLTTGGDDDGGEACVDLAHEVMITAWPTLASWIRERRADEQHRRQLEAAAAQWVARGRGAGGLLDRIELAEADAWLHTESAREVGQSADVAALIAASRAENDRQVREAEASGERLEASDRENPLATFDHQKRLQSAAFSPDGTRVVTEGRDVARLWDAGTGKALAALVHSRGAARPVFSPDGAHIVTRCSDASQIWDATTASPLPSWSIQES